MASPFSGTPVADDQTITTEVNVPVYFTLTGTSPGTMHFNIVTAPVEGLIDFFEEDTGHGLFIPSRGFEGDITFTFTVDDGSDVSDEATVTIEVLAASAAGTPSTPPPASAPPPPPATPAPASTPSSGPPSGGFAPPGYVPPPPPAPTGTGSGTIPGMGPAIAGAAAVAAGTAAAAPAGGATPPPAPGAPVAPAPAALGAPIVPPPPPPPAPAPAPTSTPWYRDWRKVALLLAMLALLAFLLWLAFGGGNCGGGAPGPVPPIPPAPPTASSTTTTPPPPPPVVSGLSCPNGYTKITLAANSCQLLGWDGERMPYEAVSSPQAGRLVVGNAPLPHQNVASGMTDVAGEDLAICWPSAIPFGAKVAANSVMWAVYGQHANHVVQPAWYSAWQSRCGLRLEDPACVRYNADGSADLTTCNMVVPVPIP